MKLKFMFEKGIKTEQFVHLAPVVDSKVVSVSLSLSFEPAARFLPTADAFSPFCSPFPFCFFCFFFFFSTGPSNLRSPSHCPLDSRFLFFRFHFPFPILQQLFLHSSRHRSAPFCKNILLI